MSEFGKLEDDAQKFAQEHPQQVKKGEEAVEDKLGLGKPDGAQAGDNKAADDHKGDQPGAGDGKTADPEGQ